MSAAGNDPFEKVKDPEEKKKILQSLVKAQTSVFLSVAKSKKGYVIFPQLYVRDQMTIQGPDELRKSLQDGDEVFFEFSSGDEKYICKTKIQLAQNLLKVDLSVDLYKLQRRDDFRLRLPASYSAQFIIQKRKYQVLDISAGGCRIQAEAAPDIKMGGHLAGTLQLKGRDPINILAAEIVHMTADHKIGLRFQKLADLDRSEIHGVVIAIYRELFTSFKNR